MEALGAEGQWTSLSGVYTAEEADFMANLLLNNNQISSTTFQNFWPEHRQQQSTISNNNIDHYYHMPTNYCSLELSNPNNSNNNNHSNMFTTSFSRGSTSPSNATNHSSFNVFPASSNDLSDQNSQQITSIDFFVGATNNSNNNNNNNHHHHCDDQSSGEDISNVAPKMIKESLEIYTKSSGKRSRSSDNLKQVEVVLGKRNTKPKKKPKLVLSIPGHGGIVNKEEKEDEEAKEEESKGWGANNGPSSSSGCWSADDNGGQESPDSSSLLTPKQPNSEAKARARRGSATDPQSLYARKRRERINERLKVLQNLVPNGTKVDISTMLEEAVQYVKYLQHQIKLLSSDELWMYAPISYNGKELELDHNLKLRLANQS